MGNKKIIWRTLLSIFFMATLYLWLKLIKVSWDLKNAGKIAEQEHSRTVDLWTDLKEIKDEFQVEDIRNCRAEQKVVIKLKEQLKNQRKYTSNVCWKIKTKPDDILNPQKYYKAIWDDWLKMFVVVDIETEENDWLELVY